MATPRHEHDYVLDHVMHSARRVDDRQQRRWPDISVNSADERVMQSSTSWSKTLGRVLVIDADKGCQGVIAEMLMDDGFAPLLCPSVDVAADVIRESQPDAVIVDPWIGPDTTAMTILDEIKHDHSVCAIPIIVCSADNDLLADHAETFQRYRCQIIPKPFDMDALLDAVHAVVVPSDDCGQKTRARLA